MSIGRWCPCALPIVGAFGFLALGASRPPTACDCGAFQEPSAPTGIGTHDPVIVKDGKRYVLFATGVGITTRTSKDLRHWEPEGRVFATPPEWAPKTIEGFRDHVWAPDVSKFGGKWHLYYSISTFGKNRSAIGHATNETLDAASPNFRWIDEGPVVQSYPSDDFNAIDPNVVLDEKGKPWLSFGSFWNGLRIVPLDAGGKPLVDAKPALIAARPHDGPRQPGAIEAPYIIRRNGWFYLFASYDFCCRGANSTYNVRVGRARSVQGPYLDREGKSMGEGGGTQITFPTERWKGPGHQAILRDGRTDLLIYHAYDAEDRGRPKLRISKLFWDRDGWPRVTSPDATGA